MEQHLPGDSQEKQMKYETVLFHPEDEGGGGELVAEVEAALLDLDHVKEAGVGRRTRTDRTVLSR